MRRSDTVGETLLALADPTRRGVVELLGRGPLRAGELAAATGSSPPAMSRHLRVLRRCGLVEDVSLESDARVRLYRLRQERFAELRGWVERIEGFWETELRAFERHVVRTRGRRRR